MTIEIDRICNNCEHRGECDVVVNGSIPKVGGSVCPVYSLDVNRVIEIMKEYGSTTIKVQNDNRNQT